MTPIEPISDEQLEEIERFLAFGGATLKLHTGPLRGMIARLRAAEADAGRFREIAQAVAREDSSGRRKSSGSGNAPGHCHDIPGVWDKFNGKLSETECAWCKTYALAHQSAMERTP